MTIANSRLLLSFLMTIVLLSLLSISIHAQCIEYITYSGYVVNSLNGDPIAGAKVCIEEPGSGPFPSVWCGFTDASGYVSISFQMTFQEDEFFLTLFPVSFSHHLYESRTRQLGVLSEVIYCMGIGDYNFSFEFGDYPLTPRTDINKAAFVYPQGGEWWPSGVAQTIEWEIVGEPVQAAQCQYLSDRDYIWIPVGFANSNSISMRPVGAIGDSLLFRILTLDMDGELAADTCPGWVYLFVCGDPDANSIVNISDAVYLISYIFGGGLPPEPLQSGDANDDGMVKIADAVYLIQYIFAGGPPPCEP